MKAKKVVSLTIIALLLFYVITQPGQAAAAVQTMLGWLKEWAEAILTFIRSLFT